jgi:hypothetical protein
MRLKLRSLWLVAALLLSGATGCVSQPAHSVKPSSDLAVLRCQDVIGSVPAPPLSSSVVLDRVALPTGQALQANAQPGGPGAFFAKDGLLIRRGAAFDIVVPDSWRGRLTVTWGSLAKPTSHLRIPGCRPTERMPASGRWDAGDAWLAYPGGYWVSKRACVSVVIESGQAQQPVAIGVGASCPGQGPPPSPA